jgi:hypothetical protein
MTVSSVGREAGCCNGRGDAGATKDVSSAPYYAYLMFSVLDMLVRNPARNSPPALLLLLDVVAEATTTSPDTV